MPWIQIYALECRCNGRVYIGSTRNMMKRLREHVCLLRNGKHSCRGLQEDFDQFGKEHFVMRPLTELIEVPTDIRRSLELHFMKDYETHGVLYNEHLISMQPPEDAPAKAAAARVANGYRQSSESNEKRRLAQLGKPKGHGAKISATKRAKAMR